MKEATGELNMTVITVVAIAAVAAIFYAFVWPSFEANMVLGTACSETGGLHDPVDPGKYGITCSAGSCTTEDGKTKVCSNE